MSGIDTDMSGSGTPITAIDTDAELDTEIDTEVDLPNTASGQDDHHAGHHASPHEHSEVERVTAGQEDELLVMWSRGPDLQRPCWEPASRQEASASGPSTGAVRLANTVERSACQYSLSLWRSHMLAAVDLPIQFCAQGGLTRRLEDAVSKVARTCSRILRGCHH